MTRPSHRLVCVKLLDDFPVVLFHDDERDDLRTLVRLELVQFLLHLPNLIDLLVYLEHIIKLPVSRKHLENDAASFDAVEAVSAAEQQLHGGFLQVVLVDVLTVD